MNLQELHWHPRNATALEELQSKRPPIPLGQAAFREVLPDCAFWVCPRTRRMHKRDAPCLLRRPRDPRPQEVLSGDWSPRHLPNSSGKQLRPRVPFSNSHFPLVPARIVWATILSIDELVLTITFTAVPCWANSSRSRAFGVCSHSFVQRTSSRPGTSGPTQRGSDTTFAKPKAESKGTH